MQFCCVALCETAACYTTPENISINTLALGATPRANIWWGRVHHSQAGLLNSKLDM